MSGPEGQASCTPKATPVAHIKITQSREKPSDRESEDAIRSTVDHEDTSTGVPASRKSSRIPQTTPKTEIQEQASVSESESESQDSADYEDTSSGTEEESTVSVDQQKTPEDTKTTVIKIEPDTTMDIEDSQIVPTPSATHSFIITLEEELVKEEPLELSGWNRAEDKLILEVLKQQLTPEERKYKTIAEILDEKNVFRLISKNIAHKSEDVIKERVLYILSLLVLSER